MSHNDTTLIACPRCRGPLSSPVNGRLQCPPCKVSFPLLADVVPLLYANPNAALVDWRNRLGFALAELQADAAHIEQDQHSHSDNTTERLGHLSQALAEHQAELQSLLAPLEIKDQVATEIHQVLGTQLATHHGVLSYMPQIFRDWCWGDDENSAVINLLQQTLTDAGAELPANPKVLIIGSGAGRLAVDLHRVLGAHTLCIDSNPLLCLLSARLSAGEALNLTEFPLAPVDSKHVAVRQMLRNPEPVENFTVACADALTLPVPEDTFDLIVTPWLIDVLDSPLQQLLVTLQRALATHGYWLNHGSMAFSGAPANRLGAEEVQEISTQAGFRVLASDETRLPYLQSPHSRQHRSELVYTQLAQLLENHTQAQTAAPYWPSWLTDPSEVVPFTPAFKAQLTNTRIHAFVMGLINGERSINDMAAVMEEQRLMPKAEARQALRGFIQKMVEESRTRDGFSEDT